MLRLPPFELRRPASAAEAVEMLAGEGSAARIVAGGTDLWPNMKRRHQQAQVVVDLMSIPGLAGITMSHSARSAPGGDPSRDLRLGATTTLTDVEHDSDVRERYPALARAVASISSPPLRNMGTIGGNVCVDTRCTYYNQTEGWRRSIDYCMKAEGEICWVAPTSPRCWAHSATDAAPMLCALGARVVLLGPEGERTVPISALYQDDGIDYLTKQPDELVTAILLPPESNADRCRTAFWKLRRRGSIDFAVLSVAVAVWPAAGAVERAEIVLGCRGLAADRGRGGWRGARRQALGRQLSLRGRRRRGRRQGAQGGDADGQYRFPDPVARPDGRALRHRGSARGGGLGAGSPGAEAPVGVSPGEKPGMNPSL